MSNIKPLTDDTEFLNTHGEVPFILIYATVIARLTLFNDLNYAHFYQFLFANDIVIPQKMMTAINDVNINDLFNDEKIFNGLGSEAGNYKDIPYYTINGRKYIDFAKMEIPQKVNLFTKSHSNKLDLFKKQESIEITDITKGYSYESDEYKKNVVKMSLLHKDRKKLEYNKNIKLISIAAANYSGIFILADKRTPNMIWVSFRCAYSLKSKGIYFTPRTLIPYKPCNNDNVHNESNKEAYAKGMFKVVANNIYAIIQAMTYLARDFLGHTEPNKVKVCTTGHSLGGALSTIFAYLFLNAMRTFDENNYGKYIYNVFIRKICCISFGAPRCMNSVVSRRFCYEVAKGNIIYKRIANQNDHVANKPSNLFYYRHPCTDTNSLNSYKRNELLRCNETAEDYTLFKKNDYEKKYTFPFRVMHYEKPLECVSYHRKAGTKNHHMIYFYIFFEIQEKYDIYDDIGNMKLCRIGVYTEETKQSLFYFYNYNKTMTESESKKNITTDNKITYEIFCELFNNNRITDKDYEYKYKLNANLIKLPYTIPYTYNKDKSNLFDENIPDPNPEMPNVICVPDARYAHLDKIVFINY